MTKTFEEFLKEKSGTVRFEAFIEWRNILSHLEIDFYAQEYAQMKVDELKSKLPPKSYSRAVANGQQYESEFDEGWNKCLDTIKDSL